jgi:hypothetical protein
MWHAASHSFAAIEGAVDLVGELRPDVEVFLAEFGVCMLALKLRRFSTVRGWAGEEGY